MVEITKKKHVRCDLMTYSVVLCSFFVLSTTVFVLQNCTVSIPGHVDSNSIMLLVICIVVVHKKKVISIVMCCYSHRCICF